MQTVTFLDQACLVLENKALRLLVTQAVGPRILALQLHGGENLFAELPDFTIECPGTGIFHGYGGHRLWHAPEDPRRTYIPDDKPVSCTPTPTGLIVTQDPEPQTGIQKSLEISLSLVAAQVSITHKLTNHGLWPIPCAPWALTQLKPGGVAILPQSQAPTQVLPNRALVMWPYTDLTSPQVRLGNRYLLLHVNFTAAFKIGFPNPRGWLAYWLNGTLFVKQAAYYPAATYCDFGSSSECYCNAQFIELETLGPLQTLAPGAAVAHTETWQLFANVACPTNEAEVQQLVETLGLEPAQQP